jgi:hypothetical protein
VIRAAPGSFAGQLTGMLRARRAFSVAQKRDSRIGWWATRVIWTVVATGLVGGSFLFGVSEAGANATLQARTGTFFLLGSLTGAGYLVLIDFRPAAHILGEVRERLPLSRRRSAGLRFAEEVVHPSTVFVLLHALAPFVGLTVAGNSWLNGWGWLSVCGLILVALAGRGGITAIKAWVLRPTSGTSEAIVRIGFSVTLLTIPVWTGAVIRPFYSGSFDVFALDGLSWANSATGPISSLVVAAAVTVFAIWARTWRGWNARLPNWPAPRIALGRSRFGSSRTELRMAQMMALRASRITSYQQAALLVGVVGVLTIWVPAPGIVPLMVGICFISPLLTFFNLYGQDSTYFSLWLTAGISLQEWTRARQIFSTFYLLLFSYAGLAVLAATGTFSIHATALIAPLPAGCAMAAIIAGPPVSRFVVTATEHRDGQRRAGSARGMAAMAAAAMVTSIVAGASLGLSVVALWAPCAGVAVLAIVSWRAGRRGHSWSSPFRSRLASSLREW